MEAILVLRPSCTLFLCPAVMVSWVFVAFAPFAPFASFAGFVGFVGKMPAIHCICQLPIPKSYHLSSLSSRLWTLTERLRWLLTLPNQQTRGAGRKYQLDQSNERILAPCQVLRCIIFTFTQHLAKIRKRSTECSLFRHCTRKDQVLAKFSKTKTSQNSKQC